MVRENKYSIRDFKEDFPSEEICIKFLFNTLHNRKCSCGGRYSPLFWTEEGKLKGRKQFQCSRCRYQLSPLANTIFHKSSTPLILWFQAIFIFLNARSGISTKEIERQLGITYKCAYRILSKIRKIMAQNKERLRDVVEVGTEYIGSMSRIDKVKKNKTPIMVAIRKDGKIKVEVVKDLSPETQRQFIERNVEKDSILVTDTANYCKNGRFFSYLKRSIRVTHKSISGKHLQSYLDAFAFQYNTQHSGRKRFNVFFNLLSTYKH